MGAGNLRDKVTFERQNNTPDNYGNVTTGWAVWPSASSKYWGNVREQSGKEVLDAGAITSVRMATVRIRKTSNTALLTEADRAIFRGQTWNIRSIAEVGSRPSMLDLLCEAGVAP